MASYTVKVYGANDRLTRRFEFSAQNDHEAVGSVERLHANGDDRQWQLWLGNRWVRTFEAPRREQRRFFSH